jgi:SagB-type dehydrogenase family enzyme
MTDNPSPSVFASLREFCYAPRGPWPADGEPVDLAEEFHLASKVAPDFPGQAMGPAGRYLATTPAAPFALGRKTLAHAGARIALPRPGPVIENLTRLAYHRHSSLPPQPGVVGLSTLGALLGLSAAQPPDRPGFRVTPSGGAMYPLDVVVIAHSVEGLDPGRYVYDPIEHGLLARGALDTALFHRRAGGETMAPPQPALTLAIVATFARSRAKYGLRGYRFVLLEAGHLAQAALTAATALGVAALPWGGFADSAIEDLLELDGLERSCIYLVAVSALENSPAGRSC